MSVSDGYTGSYSYDANGNMVEDGRKALKLEYNVLNLLSKVKNASGTTEKAVYSWLADGTKLGVRNTTNGEEGFDYLSSLIYERDAINDLKLEGAYFGDGKIVSVGNGYEVKFFFTDHLGSVRTVVDAATGEVEERNDFYPFGRRHNISGYPVSDNRFLYNGKEKQTTGNVNYLDYGARMYDVDLGRWFTQDLLAEKYYNLSAYNYCGNNPIRFVDPDGMDLYVFDVITGKYNNKVTAEGTHRMAIKSEDKDGNIIYKFYDFNDPDVDARAINNYIMTDGKKGINSVFILGDSEIEAIINNSGVKNSIWFHFYALAESHGKMDYGVNVSVTKVLDAGAFYIREGIAYNIGDIGNYLWGRGMAELGIRLTDALTGAHINNIFNGRKKTGYYDFGPGTYGSAGFFDSYADQMAIIRGYRSSLQGKILINTWLEMQRNIIINK